MATKPIKPNTVNLDGTNYVIEGAVQRELASQFPQKIVTGDFQEESHPFVSTITWNDVTGGMLNEIGTYPGSERRTFFNVANTRVAGHVTPNGVARAFGTPLLYPYNGSTISDVALYRGSRWTTTDSGGVWQELDTVTTAKVTLTSPSTDFRSGIAEGVRFLAAPQGVRIQWTHSDINDTVWLSDSSENITHVTSWRDLMWGVNDSAELFFAQNITDSATFSWTRVAQADETDTGMQKGLVVGPDGLLYMVTRRGLQQYDNTTERFTSVLDVGRHADGGAAFAVFGPSILYSQGLAIFRFTPTPDANIVDEIGLDQDGGLPNTQHGSIKAMATTLKSLFVTVSDADTTDFSGIYSYDNGAWSGVYVSSSGQDVFGRGLEVYDGSSISQFKRAIFPAAGLGGASASDNAISYMINIPNIFQNPRQLDSVEFLFDGGEFEVTYPWVLSDNEQQWTAVSVRAKHSWINPAGAAGVGSPTQYMTFRYGVNQQDSFTTVGSVFSDTDSNGETVFTLPNGGIPFTSIRLQALLKGSNVFAPDLNQLSLSYIKNLDPLWGFRFIIDTTNQQFGSSPKEVRETLKALFSKKTLFNFTFKGDAGERESYMVKPIALQSLEQTGSDESGRYALTVVEVN